MMSGVNVHFDGFRFKWTSNEVQMNGDGGSSGPELRFSSGWDPHIHGRGAGARRSRSPGEVAAGRTGAAARRTG
jgi:hypothetical protein